MARITNEELLAELQQLAPRRGPLDPQRVVDFATANRESAVGRWMQRKGCFDPAKAQANWCYQMACQLLQTVKVTVHSEGRKEETVTARAYVSLEPKRAKGEPSYYPAERVIGARANAELRSEHVRTVLSELRGIRSRYSHLKELASIWEAIDAASAGESSTEAA